MEVLLTIICFLLFVLSCQNVLIIRKLSNGDAFFKEVILLFKKTNDMEKRLEKLISELGGGSGAPNPPPSPPPPSGG